MQVVLFCVEYCSMRKRTKRKVYPLINPIPMAIEGAAIAFGPELDRLRQGELTAIESFRMGQAVDTDWQVLSVMNGITCLMAYEMKTQDILTDARLAQKCLDSIEERFKRLGKWGATGEELNAIKTVFGHHENQRFTFARSVYEDFIFRSKGVLQDPVRRQKVLYGKE